jgi:uncharacterized protein
MAMFPLGSVLLPTGMLPLHVFEQRYRQLVQDCLAADIPEFGVAMIERGSEVGGGDHRSNIATVARIVQCGQFPDGRYGLLTIGTRRVRVISWLPDDPYPRADVEDWPDADAGDSAGDEAVAAAHADVRRVVAMAIELGLSDGDLEMTLADDPTLASYQLADLAPLGPSDTFALLAAPNWRRRIELLRIFLAQREESMHFQLLHGGLGDDVDPYDPRGDQSDP